MMDKTKYLPRIIDAQIDRYLQTFGAICIEGPKWCGKTWTASYHSNSQIFLGDPAGNFQNRTLAELSPEFVLSGEVPRLIDEWQDVPPLWDAVRYKVDQSNDKGLFILTGSATPNHKGIQHSGAGRIARLRMRPMSLYESGDSSGVVSLEKLCHGEIEMYMTGEVELKNLLSLIVRGGWPGVLNLSMEQATLLPKEYLRAILEDDVYRIDGVKRNFHKMQLLLRSLARNESTTVSDNALKKDIKQKDVEDIDSGTVRDYMDIFSRLFLTDNIPPFSPNVRSSVRVKQSEKRHFCDPSLACALLNVTSDYLINDLETAGFLFEALCERDLKIYAESFGATLYHYQDYKGREIDSVIELSDGNWCAIEIKLGANQIEQAAQNLLKIKKEFEADTKSKPPSVLCVVCGLSNAAYQRPDGVFVVPVTALKN